jgi:hypothetical protein
MWAVPRAFRRERWNESSSKLDMEGLSPGHVFAEAAFVRFLKRESIRVILLVSAPHRQPPRARHEVPSSTSAFTTTTHTPVGGWGCRSGPTGWR